MSGILVTIGIVMFLAICWIVGSISHRESLDQFNQIYPPISDDEFVERCGPGTNREVAVKVRKIISDSLGLPIEQIHPEQNLVDLLD